MLGIGRLSQGEKGALGDAKVGKQAGPSTEYRVPIIISKRTAASTRAVEAINAQTATGPSIIFLSSQAGAKSQCTLTGPDLQTERVLPTANIMQDKCKSLGQS